jgi:hypothetical protein
MGIGRITSVGFGTGYLLSPGIAITAIDGITGGGAIATVSTLGISTDCFSITNPGIYTSIPNVLITPPVSGGSAATASVGNWPFYYYYNISRFFLLELNLQLVLLEEIQY